MRQRRLTEPERGNVSIEAAVLLPLLLGFFMLTVQFGMVFYARAVASSAARHGLDATRVTDGTEAAGGIAAQQFLDQSGAGFDAQDVSVNRGPEEVTVTVTGQVMSVVPGWAPTVTVTVTAPVERVVQ